MTLTKDNILTANDLPTETVNVPEWGGDVKVRSLTARERDTFEQSLNSHGKPNLSNIRARLCALCIVGDDGARLFADDEMDALGNKSATALGRVFDVAQRLNGLGQAAGDTAEKNSEPTALDASSSASA
jgi:hypothetical protein